MRSNREIQEWSDFLQSQNISIESKLKTNILNSNYVNFILNMLGLFGDPYFDDKKFLDVVLTDLVDVNNLDIFKINKALYSENYTKKFKVSLFDYLTDTDKLNTLELDDLEKILQFKELFCNLSEQMRSKNFLEFFREVISEFTIVEHIEAN
jgi:superfamily I DNA/RNA helicase